MPGRTARRIPRTVHNPRRRTGRKPGNRTTHAGRRQMQAGRPAGRRVKSAPRRLFGRTKRDIIKQNQKRGRTAEKAFESEAKFQGRRLRRTDRGHDYVEERTDPFTRKKTRIRHEIKSGNSRLSSKQRRSRAQRGENYVVHRYKEGILGPTKVSETRGKTKRSLTAGLFGSKPSKSSAKGKKTAKGAFLAPKRTAKSKGASLAGIFLGTSKTSKSTKKAAKGSLLGSILGPAKAPRKAGKRSARTKKSPSFADAFFGTSKASKRSGRTSKRSSRGSSRKSSSGSWFDSPSSSGSSSKGSGGGSWF